MYLYLKAAHVIALATFIGGLILLGLTLRVVGLERHADGTRSFGATVLKWDGYITAPALAVVWIVGIAMVFGGGWETSAWFLAKLPLVIFLSGLHSASGAALKRTIATEGEVSFFFRHTAVWTLLAFSIIAVLAVAKPI